MDRARDADLVGDQSDRAATLRSWLTAVGEIAREANSATSLAALLTRIADTACNLMACEFCAVLLINGTADPHHFSAEETALLETLADQAAIAIEAARLRARERAQIADLERQRVLLERAEEIHRDLTRAILDNAGLGGIAEALMRLLGCQVSIEDAAGRVLASSSGPRF